MRRIQSYELFLGPADRINSTPGREVPDQLAWTCNCRRTRYRHLITYRFIRNSLYNCVRSLDLLLKTSQIIPRIAGSAELETLRGRGPTCDFHA